MRYRTSWRPLTGPAYTYTAAVLTVHDGDTFTAVIDLGFDVTITTSVRLLGCNAIELGQPGGVEAGANLRQLICGKAIYLHTVKADKYGGRYDAQVTVPGVGDLATLLIADGWAAAWDGKGPRPTPPWPRQAAGDGPL